MLLATVHTASYPWYAYCHDDNDALTGAKQVGWRAGSSSAGKGVVVVHASNSPQPPTEEEPRTPTPPSSSGDNGDGQPPPEDRRRARATDLLLATLTMYETINTSLVTLIISQCLSAGGAVGSAALLLGVILNVDPFGGLHWDAHDALIGLACITPVMLADVAVMVPDYSAPRYKKTIRVAKYSPAERRRMRAAAARAVADPPLPDPIAHSPSSAVVQEEFDLLSAIAAQAEADKASRTAPPPALAATAQQEATSAEEVPDEELYVEREIMLRKPQQPLAAALHRVQQTNIFENPGRGMSPWEEALTIVTSHLTEEMLKRAVVLTALSNWLVDRMYEADVVEVDDMVHLPGLSALPHDVAAWGVVVGGALAVILFTLRKVLVQPDFGFVVPPGEDGAQLLRTSEGARASLLERLRGVVQRTDDNAAQSSGEAAPSGDEGDDRDKPKVFQQRLRSKAEKVLDDVRQRAMYSAGIEGGRRLMEWVGLSTAFVLTGNLVAPLVGSIVADAVFSLYQRTKLKVCCVMCGRCAVTLPIHTESDGVAGKANVRDADAFP